MVVVKEEEGPACMVVRALQMGLLAFDADGLETARHPC